MSHWDFNFRCQVSPQFSLTFNHTWSSECTGVYGPSGSGKTSLIEILLGFQDRQLISGQAKIGSTNLFYAKHHLPPFKRGLTWIPQENTLFPHFTVEENIRYASKHADISFIAQELNLQSLLQSYPQELSGGQRQKVALARALVAPANTILMDEPLNSLDQPVRDELIGTLDRLRRKFSKRILYVSHDLAELKSLCDYLVVIEAGKLTYGGPTEEYSH
jgi:ABC-type molybdate transport system ATPase subunit